MTSCGPGRHTVSRAKYDSDDIYYAGTSENTKKKPGKKEKNNPKNQHGADLSPVVAEAFSWLGTKYRYGGHSKSGTDCSGLVWEIYRDVLSVCLPGTAWELQKYCNSINRSALAPGDLVFFSNKKNGRVTHVGIYIGSGEMIHASTSQGVIRSDLDETYYKKRYHSSGRVFASVKNISPAENPRQTLQKNEVSLEDLDNAITEMTDSILSSYMD